MRPSLRRYLFFPRTVAYTAAYSTGVAAVVGLSPKKAFDLARRYAWKVLGAAKVTVRVDGAENLPPGPVVVIANHQSLLDVPVLLAYMPYDLYFVAKRELQYIPIFGWALKAMGHVMIDRSNREQATKSINHAARRIREGLSIVVFAEGTRSRTGELAPFKKGAFVLAIKAGVPVVPVTINGSVDLLPTGALFAEAGEVHVKVHPPIATSGYRLDTKDELIENAERVVRSGLRTGRAE